MATDWQAITARNGGGLNRLTKQIAITMVAGATVTDSTFNPPVGSVISGIRWHTPVTYTGAPTNINMTIGKTAGQNEYVTNVDVKTTATPGANTLVNSTDYDVWPAANAFFITLTAVGGTAPAGTTYVYVDYAPPNF